MMPFPAAVVGQVGCTYLLSRYGPPEAQFSRFKRVMLRFIGLAFSGIIGRLLAAVYQDSCLVISACTPRPFFVAGADPQYVGAPGL